MPILVSGNRMHDDTRKLVIAAGYTDATITAKINKVIKAYDVAGLWAAKTTAFWGIKGGTAAFHKWNYKDARDLDAARRLTWPVAMTHNSTGMVGNGAGYADTKFLGSDLSANNWRMGFWNTLNVKSDGRDMGYERARIFVAYNSLSRAQAQMVNPVDFAVPASVIGWWLLQRTGSAAWELRLNNVVIASGTDASDTTNYITDPIWLGANASGGTPVNPSNRGYATAVIGASLSSTELAAEYNAVTAFNT